MCPFFLSLWIVFISKDDTDLLPNESPATRTKFDLPEMEGNSIDAANAEEPEAKRAPLDTLARLFPQAKRALLKSTLDRCDGDVLRAIEQLVYHNNNPQSGPAAPDAPPPSSHPSNKRKSLDHPSSGREKAAPRYSHQHHHPHAEASLQWKNCLSAVGSAFPHSGSMTGSSSRPPLFPLQSTYFPAAFGYGASSFLAGSFLRPDYPVFPGMNLLTATAGGSNPSGALDPISPAAYAAYHSTPNVVLHHASPGNGGNGVKQEPELGVLMSENQSNSPRSDRSERSPYSD